MFSVSLPSTDSLDSTDGALGFVLDRVDLHVQFATTRWYHYDWSDVDTIVEDIETTWQTRDENGDGYPDLVVRETQKDDRYSGEEGTRDEHEVARRSTTCTYELAGDRWLCPEWLGTKLVDGGKRVEVTKVPVPVPEPLAETPAETP